MSLLGTFYKQPVEVEIYAIQYYKDMAATDELQSAFQTVSSQSALDWDGTVITGSYQITLEDVEKIFVSTGSLLLPATPSAGFRVYVANAKQDSALMVGAISIPARASSVLVYRSDAWVEEAKTHATLVSGPSDQRVRVRFFGGALYEEYKVQVTVTSAEGRTLQDEFIVTIEEI